MVESPKYFYDGHEGMEKVMVNGTRQIIKQQQ